MKHLIVRLFWWSLAAWTLLSISVVVVLRTYYIPSGAMSPTLVKNDVVVTNRIPLWFVKPYDGEIVVFDPPIASPNRFIKRVLAVPGEALRIHRGIVYRSGRILAEPYVTEATGYELEIRNYQIFVDGEPLDVNQANVPPRSEWTSPNTLPRGCYVLLGDNRNNSEDSHIWGCAQANGTFSTGAKAGKPVGAMQRAMFILFPTDRAVLLP